jgi:hypothetical protein
MVRPAATGRTGEIGRQPGRRLYWPSAQRFAANLGHAETHVRLGGRRSIADQRN